MNYYYDFYARANIGDQANIPKQGNLCGSPDIQPVGTETIDDPYEYFIGKDQAQTQYEVDKGTNIIANSRNYIYIRGSTITPAEGTIELYFVPSSLLMLPSSWSKNQLKGADGNTSIPFKANFTQKIVLDTPFVWENPVADEHYCLVSRIVTTSHPNKIPDSFASLGEFSNWLQNSPGIGWRNVCIVNCSKPNSTATTNLSIPQEWGSCDALVYLETTNMPNGVTVSFSSSDIDPPFKLEPQKITTSPHQYFMVITKLKGGTTGKVTYTYDRNGIEVPEGASFVLGVARLSPIGNVTSVFRQ